MVLANLNDETPSIVQIPKKEFLQLMPLEWITNYENLKRNNTLVIATIATFRRFIDEIVKSIFQKTDEEGPFGGKPPIFLTMMINVGAAEKRLPIHAIEPNGQVIYSNKIDGHFLWHILRPRMCEQDCDCDSWRVFKDN